MPGSCSWASASTAATPARSLIAASSHMTPSPRDISGNLQSPTGGEMASSEQIVGPRFDLGAIGLEGEAHAFEVTEERLRAYAEATDDVRGGPVFAIVPVFAALPAASRSVAPEEARRNAVHYEQDMVLHRPLEAGMHVVSRATPLAPLPAPPALLPRPNGTPLVIKTETRTEAGELVNEQFVTEFFRGVEAAEGVGE